MKRLFIVGLLGALVSGIVTSAAVACPVATGVAIAPSVVTLAAPVAVSSPCNCGQQIVQQSAALSLTPSVVQSAPVNLTVAVPTVSIFSTPLVVERVVKSKPRRTIIRARIRQ